MASITIYTSDGKNSATVTYPNTVNEGDTFEFSVYLNFDPSHHAAWFEFEQQYNGWETIRWDPETHDRTYSNTGWNCYYEDSDDGLISCRARVCSYKNVGSWGYFSVRIAGTEPPDTPQNLRVVAANDNTTVSGNTIRLKGYEGRVDFLWDRVSGASYYEAEYTHGGDWNTDTVYSTSRNNIGVYSTSGWYQFRVTAYNSKGIASSPSTVMYSIITNSPPSTPTSITVPGGTIYSSTPVDISWSASTDPDGDSVGYELERQLDGSGSFTQIYRGSARSYQDTIPTDKHTSVIYRVRAYDSEGNYSSYCTGPVRLIINNAAPTTPEWCSVPNPVKGGTSIKITWPASTDSDGNLSGYILQRKFNSNSWTQIYKGANRSYTDPIPLDKYKTVTYRVKAYDTKNAQSAYATSATRTIQNSTVLQFRLKAPIESTKRAAYGQEIMTYTIPSGAIFKAEACNNGFDKNPTWEDVTEFVKKQKIFEFANKTKTASKWGYDIRVTVDRNGATGNCYFTRGNGFFEEEE